MPIYQRRSINGEKTIIVFTYHGIPSFIVVDVVDKHLVVPELVVPLVRAVVPEIVPEWDKDGVTSVQLRFLTPLIEDR